MKKLYSATPLEVLSRIEEKAEEEGIQFFGVVKAQRVPLFEKYKNLVENFSIKELQYLKKIRERENPENIFPSVKSIMAFLFPYPFDRTNSLNLKKNKIAHFALGDDYHKKIKKKLKNITKEIPGNCRILCDTSPFLEKPYGAKAGLGFMGKNTLLINKIYGSAFNLGFILTEYVFEEKILNFKGSCGDCKRCLEVCPTGALEKPYFLNPEKCISFLTMEAKEIPAEPKERWGYIYGCDLCQAVCPFNEDLIFEKGEELCLPRVPEERLKENIKIVEKERIEVFIRQKDFYFPLNPVLRFELKSILKEGVYYFNGFNFEGVPGGKKGKLIEFFSNLSLVERDKPFEIFVN
ncbi:MAG: QueG-associated DUF1730 domain-containing protein [Thermoanaerobaculia bacterium]